MVKLYCIQDMHACMCVHEVSVTNIFMYFYCFIFILATTPVTSVIDTTSSDSVTSDNLIFTYNYTFNCTVRPNSAADSCEVTVKDNRRMLITSNE